MFKIASVVIDNSSKELDREFDYIIPLEFEDFIKVGMRVTVPFGNGNKYLEAYVLKIKSYSDVPLGKLKNILDAAGNEVVLTGEMMDLAYFIKSRYDCTLKEAIQTIVPPVINMKENIYIKLKDNSFNDYNKKYIEIINALNQYKEKYIEFKKLSKILNKKIERALIFKMDKENIIEIKRRMEQSVNVKTIDVFTPGNIEKCTEFINKPPGRNKRQAEILSRMLERKEELTLSQICELFQCSSSVIKGLEEKGLIVKTQKELLRNPISKSYEDNKVILNTEQNNAIEKIFNSSSNQKKVSLIHGITGSGKTEIYMNLVEKFLREGHGSIVLVPEIALTPQTVERFKGRFGEVIAVLHSRLSEGERFDEWRRIRSGEVKIVVGARSAVFAPVKNLKLIVIDEEHEYTYKSETIPRYHAREIAEYRIGQLNGMLVLGSATPSLESYYKAVSGEYGLVQILNRVGNSKLPDVKVIDMREELKSGNRSIFSHELYNGIKENIEKKEQTILFLNRRGYSTFVSCRSCGFVSKCNHCDVALTYHNVNNILSCHYCGYETKVPTKCPSCGSKYIKYFGTGTEKIEEEIKKIFPQARVLRMDMDTTRKKGEHERIYNSFKEQKADILIGTQMITKGMDFRNVTLVGVIAADTSLNLPDFRASERTFQLLTQVAGRAGRGDNRGRVVVQTYDPEHYSIKYASKHDYINFYNMEIRIRKALNYPPFTDILYILFISEKEDDLVKYCMNIKNDLAALGEKSDIEMLGPTPSHISKIKNSYRWQMMFRGDVFKYYKNINEIIDKRTTGGNISYSIDINPYNMY